MRLVSWRLGVNHARTQKKQRYGQIPDTFLHTEFASVVGIIEYARAKRQREEGSAVQIDRGIKLLQSNYSVGKGVAYGCATELFPWCSRLNTSKPRGIVLSAPSKNRGQPSCFRLVSENLSASRSHNPAPNIARVPAIIPNSGSGRLACFIFHLR